MLELFAYPYGEIGLELRDVVAVAGFKAAFGQHSGAAGRTADLHMLPRFPLNEATATCRGNPRPITARKSPGPRRGSGRSLARAGNSG